jgi:Carboxypeptidase regulatory-like domain
MIEYKLQMRTVFLIAALLSATAPLRAQASASSGDILGTVSDPNGAAVPGAQVTASVSDRGISRTTASQRDGTYHFTFLPPGRYDLKVEAPGFAAEVVEGIELRVGDTVTSNSVLKVGPVNSSVTVAANAAVVDTERTQQATTIGAQEIENLPMNRRNYLDLALLTPGVVETNNLVDSNDFRVAQTPQSGLSFGVGNGRGNNFTVDGVENYMNSGGVRPSVSQEAVQEFQVNRNSFSAEFGNALGGTINIISRSGANGLHGDVFGFLRQADLQARNYFDPGKSSYTRGQYGGTLSAPIVRNRTFVFLAYEGLSRHETDFVTIPNPTTLPQLTSGQTQLLDFFVANSSPTLQLLGESLRQFFNTANFPATQTLFRNNSGAFPYSERSNQGSIRIDHRINAKDNIFLRANLTSDYAQNADLGALVGYNRGRSVDTRDRTVMLNNTYVLNDHTVSETRMMFSHDHLDVIPTDPNGPDITISGYGSFNRELFLPSRTTENHYQLQQVFDRTAGSHNLKFGADFNPVNDRVNSETFFAGRFLFSEGIPLGSLLNVVADNPQESANLTSILKAAGQSQLAPVLNQSITALQAFNLGLPVLYQQGFGNPNWNAWSRYFGFFAQDAWTVRPNLTVNLGLRYEIYGEPSPLHTDFRNFAPRLGIAWSPARGTIIRVGGGIYYGPVNAQIVNLPATLNGTQIQQVGITGLGIPGLINPLTGQPLTSFDVYQTLLAQGVIGNRPISLQDIAQFGLKPGPNAAGRVIFGITNDYVNPLSEQASFQIEHAFGAFALSASYTFDRGARLPRMHDNNLFYTSDLPGQQPTYGFYNSAILQDNVLESTADSSYNALTIQATRRFSSHFSLNAHYTFSKSIDEVTDFNSDYEPNDQLNADAERARSAFDQRHRVVVSSVIESGFKNVWLRNFVLSPVISANSGMPFNLLTGYDNVGDLHPTTHRPFGAGRNIGIGPAYAAADLRLSRRFAFGPERRRNVEFSADAFNLLNHTNFRSINNVVGDLTLSQLPNPIVGARGGPADPLSFTSAYDPRQFQIGLRINY